MKTNNIVYSARIQKAINLAIKTHELDEQQKRKGKDIPYVTHPLTVGLILSRASASEDVVIAGILHDTIEDSSEVNKVTYELIQEMFGTEVADLVLSVTETDKGLSWDERKAAALEHITHFSEGSVLVKSADILSNCTEILADYEVSGDGMFARFNNGKESVLANYIRTMDALINRWPESPLAADLASIQAGLERIKQQSSPFVAFVMNDANRTFEVQLVNPTSTKYERVVVFTGAYSGDTDGLLETSKVIKEKGTLLPNGFILLDGSDYDELDFVIWYHLDLYPTLDSTPTMVWFELPKYGGNYDAEAKQLPVIEKEGVRLDLMDRIDKKSIEQEAKDIDMSGKYTKSASSD